MVSLKVWLIQTKTKDEVGQLPWLEWFKYKTTMFKLEWFKLPTIAQSLYEEMYTGFAQGDLNTVQRRLCEGVYTSLEARIQARPPNTKLKWTLHRYLEPLRIVSYRATLMSSDEQRHERSTIQQVVVKVRSMQSLNKVKRVRAKDGTVTEVLEEGSVGAGTQGREVTEYLVLQKMRRRGKPGEWMVWGTTEESTAERLKAKDKKKPKLVAA